MAYWSIAVFILSISFLAYKHPPAQLEPVTGWLRPGRRRGEDVKQNGGPLEVKSPPPDEASDADIGPQIDVTEPAEAESTPKAVVTEPETEVPKLSMNGSTPEASKQPRPPKPSVPLFPAANSAQRASTVPRPPQQASSLSPNGPSNLMPPPPRPSSLQPPPTSTLRTPTIGPLPNRGPPQNSQQRVTNTLAPTSTTGVPKARGKVQLRPGHSPMDWAALTKTHPNLSGVPTLQRVTPSQLKSMTGRRGKPAWTSWRGRVYNVTPYLPFHPGGEAELMRAVGRDAGKLFMEVHPWVNWENMLGSCLVGVMVGEGEGGEGGEESSSLEAID